MVAPIFTINHSKLPSSNQWLSQDPNREIKHILEKAVRPGRKDWSLRLDEAL